MAAPCLATPATRHQELCLFVATQAYTAGSLREVVVATSAEVYGIFGHKLVRIAVLVEYAHEDKV